MKKTICRYLLALGLILSGCTVHAEPITDVEVHVHGPQFIPAAVQERMEASLRVIGNRVLVGTDTDMLQAHKRDYGNVIADVAGRVMGGYAVTDVVIQPGQHTRVQVAVVPYGKIVKNVVVHVDYGNLSPEAIALVAQDLGRIDTLTERILVGLPVDSLDWVGSISDTLLTERLASRLPEFIVQTRIHTAETAEVNLYLIPRGVIVREAEVAVKKTAIPKLFLNGAVRRIEKKLPAYVGLPADFLTRHAAEVTADLLATGSADFFVSQYQIDLSGNLQTGSQLRLELSVDTTKWNMEGNVSVGVGKKQDGVILHGHIGRRLRSQDILFTEWDFFPNRVRWDGYIGYAHEFPQHTVAGYRYKLMENDHRIWMKQWFGRQWYIQWEHGFRQPDNDYRVGYRWNENVGVEYVLRDDDRWLRIIGYL